MFFNANQDRILATCAENGLEYVTDATNFQPELTLRNAIRQRLKEEEAYGSGATVRIMYLFSTTLLTKVQPEKDPRMESLPAKMKEQLDKMKEASERLRSVHYDISGGTEQLRGAVKVLSSQVTDINDEGWTTVCAILCLLITMF